MLLKTRTVNWTICVFAVVVLAGIAAVDSPAAEQARGPARFEAAGNGWKITGSTYAARIDESGNLSELVVKGVSFLGQREIDGNKLNGGTFPGNQPAASVERKENTITAVRGEIEVAYTFDDAGFTLISRGGQVNWALSDSVEALVLRGNPMWGGRTDVIPPDGNAGDVRKIIGGGAAVAVGQYFHIIRGRLFPSFTTRGGQWADRFECRFDCGVDYQPAEMVALQSWAPAEGDPRSTAEYEPGQTPQMKLTLNSLADREVTVEIRFEARDHPQNGERILYEEQSITLPAGGEHQLTLDVQVERPGLYWVDATLMLGERPWLGRTRGFIYDLENYKPELTRPDDFKQFWQGRLDAMRAIPFDAKLVEEPEFNNERFVHYALEINDFNGKRINGYLRLPRAEGPHDAEVGGYRGEYAGTVRGLGGLERQPDGVGMWQRGGDRIRVGVPLPDESTYTRWVSRDDNNLLDSYLRNVRMMDYLRSRDDVKQIYLFGASRTGASMLAAGALSPERVAAVNLHVPTSCGLSWRDRTYRGWGSIPSAAAGGLQTAAYVDVTNFAPDIIVPVVMDGGFYDGLSPVPGILAFYTHAVNAPFRRCAIEQGQHGYFERSRRGEMESALAEYLKQAGE